MSHLPTLGSCSPLSAFPSAVAAHFSDGAKGRSLISRGRISCDEGGAQLAFIHRGPHLEVVQTRTNERLAAWTFGHDASKMVVTSPGAANSEELDNEITCVEEISTFTPSLAGTGSEHNGTSTPSSHFVHGRRYAVVGLANGLLCLLDLKSSRVVRAIQLKHRVTSIAVISNGGGPAENHRNLAEELMFFHGIVAVGTMEGHIYLVDLALDLGQNQGRQIHQEFDDQSQVEILDDVDDQVTSDESRPATLCFVGSKTENIADLRAGITRKGRQHLCLALNDGHYRNRAFQHLSSQTGDSTYFPMNGVTVCALEYIPQLGTLAAGFNFGSWQLWSISPRPRHFLEYSSPYDGPESLPITDFTFQEPENDPRNFCYLWTLHSENDFDFQSEKMAVDSTASLTLYALSYESRDEADQYGVLYSGLSSCHKRFQYELKGSLSSRGGAPTSSSPIITERELLGSLGISCATLGSGNSSFSGRGFGRGHVDLSDLEGAVNNLGIAVFLWEVHWKNDKQADYLFGLFDLNAWYRAQMPFNVELIPNTQCSYFSICSLEEIVAAANDQAGGQSFLSSLSSQSSHNLINLGIDVNTLSRYQSLSNAEQHFYPSSLAFDMVCLLDRGLIYTTNLGLQRKVLLELQSRGRTDLADPQHLYQLCLMAGLVANSDVILANMSVNNSTSGQNSQLDLNMAGTTAREQRSQLLTVALENHLVSLLTSCIWHWRDGKYSHAGCSLKFLLEWAWERVTGIKHSIDKVTLPLFDLSCVDLNEATRKSLMQNSQQLRHLRQVLEGLIKNAGLATIHGMDDLETKFEVTSLVNQYLEVILWFFNAGLLPEVPEEANNEDAQSSNNPYPMALLVNMYKTKRKRMRQELTKFSFADTPVLIIDGLCAELGETLQTNFEREGGDGLYPPPSLHALLTMYLINQEATQLPSSSSVVARPQYASAPNVPNFAASAASKHRIVQYIFLDIASYLCGDKWASLIENLIKFPSAFSVPPSVIKLTQAFWLLDHEDYEEAMAMLLDPLISNNDIAGWQHRAILVLFLVQNHPKLALKYSRIRKPPQKDLADIQLHIAILLANGMVHEAFQFQRHRRNTANASKMLQYFFEKVAQLSKLDNVLQLSLNSVEEKELIEFLKASNKPGSSEILLMYYLQRSRYGEAMRLNDDLNSRPESCSKGAATRKAIMDRFSKANLVPGGLFNRFNKSESHMKLFNPSQRNYPVPLSLEIKRSLPGEFNPKFHSYAIHEEMERKRQEMENHQITSMNAFTPFRPKGQIKFASSANKTNLNGSYMDECTMVGGGLKRKCDVDDSVPNVVFPKDVSLLEASVSEEKDMSMTRFEARFETPPPNKRSRLETSNLNTPFLTAGIKRVAQIRESTSKILSVLVTPKIKKKPRKSMAEAILGEVEKPAEIATPQSILKVKRFMSAQTPDSADVAATADGEEPAWLARVRQQDSKRSQSRESTPGKSLRFHVPKRLPMEDMLEKEPPVALLEDEEQPNLVEDVDSSKEETKDAIEEQKDSDSDICEIVEDSPEEAEANGEPLAGEEEIEEDKENVEQQTNNDEDEQIGEVDVDPSENEEPEAEEFEAGQPDENEGIEAEIEDPEEPLEVEDNLAEEVDKCQDDEVEDVDDEDEIQFRHVEDDEKETESDQRKEVAEEGQETEQEIVGEMEVEEGESEKSRVGIKRTLAETILGIESPEKEAEASKPVADHEPEPEYSILPPQSSSPDRKRVSSSSRVSNASRTLYLDDSDSETSPRKSKRISRSSRAADGSPLKNYSTASLEKETLEALGALDEGSQVKQSETKCEVEANSPEDVDIKESVESEECKETELPSATQPDPICEEPAIEEPAIEEPTETEPSVDEQTHEEPAIEEPTEAEPFIEEQTNEEPAVMDPAEAEPNLEEPIPEEPVVEEPTEAEPIESEGTFGKQPIYEQTIPAPTEKEISSQAEAFEEEPVKALNRFSSSSKGWTDGLSRPAEALPSRIPRRISRSSKTSDSEPELIKRSSRSSRMAELLEEDTEVEKIGTEAKEIAERKIANETVVISKESDTEGQETVTDEAEVDSEPKIDALPEDSEDVSPDVSAENVEAAAEEDTESQNIQTETPKRISRSSRMNETITLETGKRISRSSKAEEIEAGSPVTKRTSRSSMSAEVDEAQGKRISRSSRTSRSSVSNEPVTAVEEHQGNSKRSTRTSRSSIANESLAVVDKEGTAKKSSRSSRSSVADESLALDVGESFNRPSRTSRSSVANESLVLGEKKATRTSRSSIVSDPVLVEVSGRRTSRSKVTNESSVEEVKPKRTSRSSAINEPPVEDLPKRTSRSSKISEDEADVENRSTSRSSKDNESSVETPKRASRSSKPSDEVDFEKEDTPPITRSATKRLSRSSKVAESETPKRRSSRSNITKEETPKKGKKASKSNVTLMESINEAAEEEVAEDVDVPEEVSVAVSPAERAKMRRTRAVASIPEDEILASAVKKRGSRSSKIADEVDSPKRSTRRTSRSRTVVQEEEEEEEPKPRRTSRSNKSFSEETKAETKTKRASRSNASTMQVIPEDEPEVKPKRSSRSSKSSSSTDNLIMTPRAKRASKSNVSVVLHDLEEENVPEPITPSSSTTARSTRTSRSRSAVEKEDSPPVTRSASKQDSPPVTRRTRAKKAVDDGWAPFTPETFPERTKKTTEVKKKTYKVAKKEFTGWKTK